MSGSTSLTLPDGIGTQRKENPMSNNNTRPGLLLRAQTHDCSQPPPGPIGSPILGANIDALQTAGRRVSSPHIHTYEELPPELRSAARKAEIRGGIGDGYEL